MQWGWVVTAVMGMVSGVAVGAGPVTASPPAVSCLAGVTLQPLSLADALGVAFSRNPRLLSAQQDLQKAKAKRTTAIAAFMPSVTASLQNERFVSESPGVNSLTTIGSTVVGGDGDRYTNYPSVGINWNLFNGGKDWAALHAAQAGIRASNADVSNQFNDTASEILTAYNDLLKAQAAFAQQTNANQIRQAMVVRAERRYQGAAGTLITLDQARMAQARAERESFKGCRAVLDKSATLAQAMGVQLAPSHAFAPAGPIPIIQEPTLSETAIEAAVQNDPSVIAAKERKVAAERSLDEARSVLYPTVSFTARYDWLGQARASYSYAWHATSDNSYRYGFELQQALFPFASYAGAAGSARADIAKADAAYQDALLKAETRLREALNAQTEAIDAADSARRSTEDAQYVLRLSQALFEHGNANLDTVDRARLDAGTEAEFAQEAAYDKRLNAWLAYRSLFPDQFAQALIRAVGDASPQSPH